MLNAEKHKSQLLALAAKKENFAVNKNNKTVVKMCLGLKCDDCLFKVSGSTCPLERIKWLLSEYKEPIKLSKLEYDILKWIKENTQFEYIVRNEIGHLFASSGKPAKQQYVWTYRERTHELSIFDKLFKFVKCEDEKPTLIQSILENCEVVNDAKEL